MVISFLWFYPPCPINSYIDPLHEQGNKRLRLRMAIALLSPLALSDLLLVKRLIFSLSINHPNLSPLALSDLLLVKRLIFFVIHQSPKLVLEIEPGDWDLRLGFEGFGGKGYQGSSGPEGAPGRLAGGRWRRRGHMAQTD
jgi:hypothetical protein